MLRIGGLAASSLLGLVLLSGTATAADGPRSDLFIVPETAAGAAARQAADARTVADYEAFRLVSVPDGAGAALRDAGGDRRNDLRVVRTEAGPVDPRADREPLAGDGEGGLALVQFVGPVKDAWLAELRATGARVVTYMASDGFLVHGSGSELAAVAKLADASAAVRAATPYTAADKLADGAGSEGDGLAIETLAGAAGADVRGALAGARELRPPSRVGETVTVFVARAGAAALAAEDSVVTVEPYVEPELYDERAAQIVAGNLNPAGTAPTAPGYLAFLNGAGFPGGLFNFAIDVTDEGIDTGLLPPPPGAHTDFFLNGSGANGTRIRYSQEFGSNPDARDCGGHGTNVASIAAGFNTATGVTREDAQGFNYGIGIAPRARLGATKIFTCPSGSFDPGITLTALTQNAFTGGARISNNSWGANVGGAYNADSREYDMLVRDAAPGTAGNQQMVEVFAAGNSGSGGNTVGSPGTGKNMITVGATENARQVGFIDGCGVSDAEADSAKDIVDFSSRGPTDDGRTKPDVVAPGTHVTGASPQHGSYNGAGTCNSQFPAGNTLYSLVSGTSQATPEVSGFAALIRDWFRRTHGGGTTVPSPALTKAIMVNTATDIAGGSDGAGGTNGSVPTQIQGWGRVNLGNVLDPVARAFVDQTTRFASTGQSKRFVYNVSSASEPLRVTMAFTDAPGPLSGNAFVNDLDLVVHAGGESYKGNVLTNGVSKQGGVADPRNNLESVFLPAGFSGRISVEVVAKNIVGDGVPGTPDTTDQDFALVTSNAVPGAGPVLVHDLTVATELAASDGDNAIEPGEAFSLRERIRNKGDATATGISAALSATEGGITVPKPNAAYNNILVGTAKSNGPLFKVKLAPSFPCGTKADLEIDLTTAQGPATIPVEVPVGTETSAAFDSTDVPKPLPDLATTESTLTVPGGARLVSDVNVRIGSLTHTFDGDLEIRLVAPDATQVLLADNRGGSGDNYTSTVFDDEAGTAITGGSAPFTGAFRPDQPLAAFDGTDASGTWTLRITDTAGGDSGILNSWGLDVVGTGGC